MQRLAVACLAGLLALSSPSFAQQTNSTQPWLCDPRDPQDGRRQDDRQRDDRNIACIALIGAALGLLGFVVYEVTKNDDKAGRTNPVSP